MSWFLSKKPKTATEWHDQLLRKPNIQQAAKVLFSDLIIDDKVKIVLSMPKSPFKKRRDVAWLEFKLEDAGHTQLAQVVRFACWIESSESEGEETAKWFFEVIRGDIKARWITQREIYLQEEVHSLHKSLSLSTDDEEASSRLKEYEEELESLKKQYMDHSRQLWCLEAGEETLIGTSVHGCARTARDAVDAVDETVDAVKRPGETLTIDGIMAIAPVHVAVASARMAVLPIVWRANYQMFLAATQ